MSVYPCVSGVYDIEQSRRILLAGKAIGLHINFHGDELNYTGSAEASLVGGDADRDERRFFVAR